MTRLIVILCSFFLVPVLVQSQSSFDISLAPELGYFQGINKNGAEQNDLILERVREVSQPSPNWRVGVHYNQQLSDHLFLRTGIRWADLGYQTKEDEFLWGTGCGKWEWSWEPGICWIENDFRLTACADLIFDFGIPG